MYINGKCEPAPTHWTKDFYDEMLSNILSNSPKNLTKKQAICTLDSIAKKWPNPSDSFSDKNAGTIVEAFEKGCVDGSIKDPGPPVFYCESSDDCKDGYSCKDGKCSKKSNKKLIWIIVSVVVGLAVIGGVSYMYSKRSSKSPRMSIRKR
jgi:hypothetical protein